MSIGAVPLVGSGQMFYLIWLALLASLVAARNLLDSRAGRAMRALRGGNALVESLGINALQVRLATFVIAALLAALSGWLYAHMSRFVSPTPFDVTMSIVFLMMAMVGGQGYLLGAVVGAALITLLKNWIQDLLPLIAPSTSGQLEIVVFSALFIVFLQRARDGIVPYVAQWLPETRRERPPEAEPLPRRAQPDKGRALMTVEAATRRFGGLIAVNEVGFEVRAGEILALIGPNGAGKTTMFNLITGALRASGGRIVFADKDITRASACSIARAGIARTFQHVKLRPKMSLIDNVLLGAYSRTRSGFFAGAAAARPRRGKARAQRSDAPARSRRAWAAGPTILPAICRSATSVCSRSPARLPPIRCCWCSTSRRQVCAGRRNSSSPSCCALCAPKASPFCWSSTTWTSSWASSTASS